MHTPMARHYGDITLFNPGSGEKDDLTDPNQACQLADAIVSHGGKAHAIIYPDYGHRIPVSVRNREIDPFIEELIGK